MLWKLRSDEHIDHIVPFPSVLWKLRSDEHIDHIVPFPSVLWKLRSDEHIDHIAPFPPVPGDLVRSDQQHNDYFDRQCFFVI